MREYLKKLPQEIQDLIYLARETAVRRKVSAYLVGGFVRDLVLGVKNFDLDIVVEADGIKFAEEFAQELGAKLIRHRRFGTATVISKPHLKIDIATARKEFYPEPAHLPVVESGTLRDDLFRRDFTVNAMAIGIADHSFGQLLDFFEGMSDLRKKRICVMHKLSFIDDPTRILRAVRFEQRYNFRIAAETLKFLKEAVGLKMLEKVEPQRIRDDLILILKEDIPVKEIRRIERLSGFSFLSPKLKLSGASYRLLQAIHKEVLWFKAKHAQRRHLDAWLIYMIGLFDRLQAPVIKDICRRFAFKRGEEKRILDCKAMKKSLISELCKEGIRPSRVWALLEPLSYEAVIFIKAKYQNRNLKKHVEDFLEIYNGTRIHISGDDLHKLGINPGPYYQKIFKNILNAKLDGLVKTKDEELTLVKKILKRHR
jgi:tRNA nucleotidyltransferase (CCA-adding enzyme)